MVDKKIDTGLCDSVGEAIHVGDLIKMIVTGNSDLHGEWAYYEVKQKGLTPILSYIKSDKGQIVPKGYLSMVLCDNYNMKNFLMCNDIGMLNPLEEIHVVTKDVMDHTVQDKE